MRERPASARHQSPFMLGGLKVVPSANELGDARIDAKAMDLLVALAEAAPDVLSVPALLERVWPGVVVADNVVHQAVRTLRRALQDDARTPAYLESIPRRGYRIVATVQWPPAQVAVVHEGRTDLAPAQTMPTRINLGVHVPNATADPLGAQLARAVARHLRWEAGAFKVQVVASDVADAAAHVRHFGIDINVHADGAALHTSWQVTGADSDEVVIADVHVEHASSFSERRERLAEMVSDSILRGIIDHELRAIADRDVAALSYGALVLLGGQYAGVKREQLEHRQRQLQRAIALEPATAIGHALLADLISWKLINGFSGDTAADAAEARAQTEIAFELEPNEPRTLLTIGQSCCRLGDYDKGLALLRRALQIAPTIRARQELAKSLCFAGQPEAAIPLFTELLDALPSGHSYQYVYGRLAVALTQAGRLDEAMTYSSMYVLQFATDYYGWIVHANLVAQRGRIEDARAALAQALLRIPKLRLESVIANTEATYGRTEQQRHFLTAGLRALR